MSTEPKHDGGADDLIAQDSAGAHILQFRSPVYVSRWIDDQHVVVGGGGNNRFGMTNGLAVLQVAPTQPEAASGKAPPLWRYCSSVDLRGNILWCISNMVYTADSGAVGDADAPAGEGHFCVSHLDSFSVIHCRGLRVPKSGSSTSTTPVLRKICRVALRTDDPETGEPDKKPVAMARGLIFAAQDDGTVAVVRLSKLLEGGVKSTPAKQPAGGAPSDNGSFASYSSNGIGDAVLEIGSRVNDIAARSSPWDDKSVLVLVACKDKKARVYQFNTLKMAPSRKIELSDVSLGFAAGSLLRSSLRVCSSFEQQLPITDRLAAPQKGVQDPRDVDGKGAEPSKVYATAAFLLLSCVEGKGYVQRVIMTQDSTEPKIDRPICIGKEAPTAVTHARIGGGVRFTGMLVGTAEGSVYEFLDKGLAPLVKRRSRKALHSEPISAIAMNANGAVVSADIAQRIIISWNGVSGQPRHNAMTLFAKSRGQIVVKVLALVALLVLLGWAALFFGEGMAVTWLS